MGDIMFVGNGRCYHTMDWYRNAKEVCHPRKVFFATDLIESEGNVKLVREDDNIVHLFNIDRFLFRSQSNLGNLWRNLVKLLVFPFQIHRLKAIARRTPGLVYHAHSMYYVFICWLAKIKCVATPQGSEILVRPKKSRLYRYFAIKSLKAAKHITVDSIKMRDQILQLSGKNATVIQNGVDVRTIERFANSGVERTHIISIRGFQENYRIDYIVRARNQSSRKPPLLFSYPLWEDGYRTRVRQELRDDDMDLGRVMPKTRLFEILSASLLAVSIPISDSSPRSVYEAVFCGCCVAVTKAPWIDALPSCMRSRLFIVDVEDDLWLERAIEHAEKVTRTAYIPSRAALELFDERRAIEVLAAQFY